MGSEGVHSGCLGPHSLGSTGGFFGNLYLLPFQFELPVTELVIPVKDDTTDFEEQANQPQLQNVKDDQE